MSSVHVGMYKIPLKDLVSLSSGLVLMLGMTSQPMPTTSQSLAWKVHANVHLKLHRVYHSVCNTCHSF